MPQAEKPRVERRMVEGSLLVEALPEQPRMLVGHAAVFGAEADICGWFREVIAPGAFAAAVARDDVRALWNHDPSSVLGRTKSGTLRLTEDDRGLRVEIDPPDTQLGRDLLHLVERGDVSQMSFGFRAVREEWDETDPKNPVRTLLEVELKDVSLVTFPAYEETEISARSEAALIVEARRTQATRAAHELMRMKIRLAEIS